MPNRVTNFYKLNPRTLYFIKAIKFLAINFCFIAIASKYNNLRKEINRRELSATVKFHGDFVLTQSLFNPTKSYKHLVNLCF